MFDSVTVINLARREDRLSAFMGNLPCDWPFPQPERFPAIDGTLFPPPAWWRPPAGAWGCLLSHAAVLADAIQAGHDSILICEDDCAFVDGFSPMSLHFLEAVPSDWGMIYLGGGKQYNAGQLISAERVNDHVLALRDTALTHCYAVHKRAMLTVYRHICDVVTVPGGRHVDNHLQTLHRRRAFPVYGPCYWLVGQRAGSSDVNTDRVRERDDFYNYACGPDHD